MLRGFLKKSVNTYIYLRNQNKLPIIILRNVSNFQNSGLIKNVPSNTITNTPGTIYYDYGDDLSENVEIKELKDEYVNKSSLIIKVKQITLCNQLEAEEIVDKYAKQLRSVSNKTTIWNVNLLKSKGTSTESIIENPSLLFMNNKSLKLKLEILELFNPRNINDYIPLLKMGAVKLNYIVKLSKRERNIPGNNRLYFLSDKLNLPPKIVAKYFSTHPFMFDIALDNLIENLNIFLNYKVAPINIVRDLWAFKYTPKAIQARLERAKEAQKDKIMPWMVRCPENILAKSLQISVESKALLGENDSVIDYLSKRLGYDYETTKYIVMKHPAILTVRITKIKEILDYLLSETVFTPHHIAQVPRILCHGLATTKYRINELKSYDCTPSSLVILCKSQTEYRKFLNNWITIRNKIRDKN